MAWTKWTLAACACAMVGGLMSGCCCKHCQRRDPSAYLIEDVRDGAPMANIYELDPVALRANTGPVEKSANNRLVRICGKTPGGEKREFGVFFGPRRADLAALEPGKGKFTNSDPGWECTQGYAILRGIRPSGSTQYIKATSSGTTIIILVDKAAGEERIMVTEGVDAKVWLKTGTEPASPNLLKGQRILVTITEAGATLSAAVDYTTDDVCIKLLEYLEKVRGAKDLGFK